MLLLDAERHWVRGVKININEKLKYINSEIFPNFHRAFIFKLLLSYLLFLIKVLLCPIKV